MVTLSEGFAVDFAVLNYAKYIRKVNISTEAYLTQSHKSTIFQNVVSKCPKGQTIEEVGPY